MISIRQNMDAFRRPALWSFIFFLSVSAGLALVAVLTGNFGKLQVRILVTTSVIAATSVGALSNSAYSSRTGNVQPATAGILLACLSAALIIIGIWFEPDTKWFWKPSATLSFFAIAFAWTLALIGIEIPRRYRWIKMSTGACIFMVSALVSLMFLFETSEEAVMRPTLVLAILAALGTLVIPILGRIFKVTGDKALRKLVLSEVEGGLFADENGKRYRVDPLPE